MNTPSTVVAQLNRDLRNENVALTKELAAAKAENDGLRKALEFYANLNNWIEVTNYLDGDIESTEPSAAERDLGQIARDALERM